MADDDDKNELMRPVVAAFNGYEGEQQYENILGLCEAMFNAVVSDDMDADKAKELRQILDLARKTVGDKVKVSRLQTPMVDANHFSRPTPNGPFSILMGGDDSD